MTEKEASEQKKTEQKAPDKQKESQSSRTDAALSAFLSLLQASETGTLSAEPYAKEALREGAQVLGNQLFQNTLGGDGAALCEKPSPEMFSGDDLPANPIRTEPPALCDPRITEGLPFGTVPAGIAADPFRILDREEPWYE